MPAERVPMRQAREIGRRLGLAPSTVRETLKRLASAGLSWPLREGISDAELETALYANRRSKRRHRRAFRAARRCRVRLYRRAARERQLRQPPLVDHTRAAK
jgi:transposase